MLRSFICNSFDGIIKKFLHLVEIRFKHCITRFKYMLRFAQLGTICTILKSEKHP